MAKSTTEKEPLSVCGSYGYDASCRAAAVRKGAVVELIRIGLRIA